VIRRLPRIALWSLLVLAAPALSGCANFDPDSLDIFGLSEKKKLPGERRDVFPEGVPGVSQGIPPEYIRGNQPGADAAPAIPPEPAAQPQQAAAAPVAAEKPKRTVKRAAPKPAPKPAAAAPVTPVQTQAAPAAQPAPQQAPAAASTGAWPAPAQPAPSGSSAWPAPRSSSTFQR
jgi:hypothetical protein